jgi:hypothetical protein
MKTLRLAGICLAIGLWGTALGQGRVIEFAHGAGVLTSRDGAEARIEFRVRQQGDNPAEGALRFTARGRDGATITIFTERLPRLEVRGEHATFGGPAVLEVSGRDGFRWEGQVTVAVRNDQRLNDSRDARIVDFVEVSFTSDRTGRSYRFAGWTQPRNIEIGVRRP